MESTEWDSMGTFQDGLGRRLWDSRVLGPDLKESLVCRKASPRAAGRRKINYPYGTDAIRQMGVREWSIL